MAGLKDLIVNGTTRLVGRLYVNDSTVVSNLNADMVDGKHASDFSLSGHNHDGRYLRYEGWWTSGNGNNANNGEGMVFAYTDHNVPGPNWGILTTFSYERGSSYKFQIFSN